MLVGLVYHDRQRSFGSVQPARDVSDIKMYATSEFMRSVYECRSLSSYKIFNGIHILSLMVSDFVFVVALATQRDGEL